MVVAEQIRVADEAWVALALLHKAYPDRAGFTAREITDKLRSAGISPELRPGLMAHIYQHNVANVPPNSARYRMFYRLPDHTFRLFRPGDDWHPARSGKTCPNRAELPGRYHELLEWYEREYCRGGPAPAAEDPILRMLGVGKHIWESESGDAFVARERAAWDAEAPGAELPVPPVVERLTARTTPGLDEVWRRVVEHEREVFHTKTGLPFTYEVESGSGLWFVREGKRINKRLWRGELEKAIGRCPLGKVTDVSDCFDPSYVYALLMDRRIRGNDW
jgi:hypothetical protein